jgi:zinc protease
MFFRSNAKYPEPESFVGRAGDLGAVFNGTTSEERVNYYLTVYRDSLEAGIRFLSAALTAPLFRQDELERERQVVIGEYDRNESSPFFQLNREMDKLLYPGNFARTSLETGRSFLRRRRRKCARFNASITSPTIPF